MGRELTLARTAALVVSVLVVASCSKLRGMAGGGSATPQASQKPMTGYEDGQEVHVQTGPLPSHGGGDQTWHVQPLKCSVDERVLGMCGDSPVRPSHSSTYVPSYQSPPPPAWKPTPSHKHH